jgi:hypothetical protein
MQLFGLFYQEEDHFKTVHGRVYQGLLLWDVFCYSLMSAELAARSHKVGVGVASGLVALGEVGDATRGSVLPLLLHVAKATQSQSRQAVLLRARAMAYPQTSVQRTCLVRSPYVMLLSCVEIAFVCLYHMIMGLLLLVSTLTGSVDGIVLYRLAVLLSHCLQNFQYGALM